MGLNERIKTYTHISTELAALSDVRLAELLRSAKRLRSGAGGHSALLAIDDTNIFFKMVPLTDLERQPNRIMSTANHFELPLLYQYAGKTGFGAWRELLAHVMTTNWVLSGDCQNFPLMYHWRIMLSRKPGPMSSQQAQALAPIIQKWGNSEAVRNRYEAVYCASACLVLFLEYFPETLHQWLQTRLTAEAAAPAPIISFAENNLKATFGFLKSHGFSHYDAHFKNILTDGKQIYLTDFGLALSSKFELTQAEAEFLSAHRSFDQCFVIVNLLESVLNGVFGVNQWETELKNDRVFVYRNKQPVEMEPSLAEWIKSYFQIGAIMGKWNAQAKKSMSSTYPATRLEPLIAALDGW